MSTTVRVEMKPISTILANLGVDANGDVQMQLTRIINKRITKYMPFRTGMLATKQKVIQSPTEIVVYGPQARYLYYGKAMVNAATGKGPMLIPDVGYRYHTGTVLKVTDRPLEYDKTKHPEAGPFWDKRMMASEKDAIEEEIQAYVGGRKNDSSGKNS